MKLTRGKRIALELLGPTMISSALILLIYSGQLFWEKGATAEMFHQWGQYAVLVPFGALMLSGLQSIGCTVFLEWRFKHGLSPTSWGAVRLASVLGFLSGGAIGTVFAVGADVETGYLVGLGLGGLGLLVGFLLGLMIKIGAAQQKGETVKSP